MSWMSSLTTGIRGAPVDNNLMPEAFSPKSVMNHIDSGLVPEVLENFLQQCGINFEIGIQKK
jgi:hypothetical protein